MDYPYKVPANWELIPLLESFYNRTSSRKIQQKQYAKYGKIAIIDQGREIIGGYTDDENIVFTGNLPVIIFGDHTRCVKYIDFPFAQGADGVKVLESKKFFLPKALFYALQNLNIPNMGYRRHYTLFKNYSIPLPPLPEQHRIIARIESLFSKLDEAKEKAQSVLDGFENRRAAILHKAFTGELTKNWRAERGVNTLNWNILSFEETIAIMQNGLSKRNGTTGKAYVVLSLANLSDECFVEDNLREVLLTEKEQEVYKLNINDVIMIRVNGSKDNVGKQFLFTTQQQWAFCDHLIRIKYRESLVPNYMVYFSKTGEYKLYIKENMISSAGQNTISRKGLAKLKIPVPTLNEQQEIVRILDRLLSQEQQAKQAAEAVIAKVDVMKKSILARAFRGELGTNDPSDEPAKMCT